MALQYAYAPLAQSEQVYLRSERKNVDMAMNVPPEHAGAFGQLKPTFYCVATKGASLRAQRIDLHPGLPLSWTKIPPAFAAGRVCRARAGAGGNVF